MRGIWLTGVRGGRRQRCGSRIEALLISWPPAAPRRKIMALSFHPRALAISAYSGVAQISYMVFSIKCFARFIKLGVVFTWQLSTATTRMKLKLYHHALIIIQTALSSRVKLYRRPLSSSKNTGIWLKMKMLSRRGKFWQKLGRCKLRVWLGTTGLRLCAL